MISKEKTLKCRSRDKFCDEETFRIVLEAFGYGLENLEDHLADYYQKPEEFLSKFKLIIVSLDLTEDYADIITHILYSNLPCVFIGDSELKPSGTFVETIAKYFPPEVAKITSEYSPAKIPFFSSTSSLIAFLDTERRFELHNLFIKNPGTHKLIQEAAFLELSKLKKMNSSTPKAERRIRQV